MTPHRRLQQKVNMVLISTNRFSTFDIYLHTHTYLLSLAKQNPVLSTSHNSNYSTENAYPASQIPNNTLLARRIPTYFTYTLQDKNLSILARREIQSFKTNPSKLREITIIVAKVKQ